VLELGSGLGLAGVAAARAGARVVFTDYEEDALAFCRFNALINGCRGAEFHLLDWRRPRHHRRYQTIIASDIIYERAVIYMLLAALDVLLLPGGSFVVAEPGRPIAETFFTELRLRGFASRKSEEEVKRPGRNQIINIHHITWGAAAVDNRPPRSRRSTAADPSGTRA